MKIKSKTVYFRHFFLLTFIFSVFSLSASAQFTGVGYIAKTPDDSRQRVVKTGEKTIVVSSKSAFTTFDLEKQAFDLLNAQRIGKGLPELEWNDEVARIARMHSENMAKFKFFSHTGIDGSMVDDRADLCGVSKWKAIGENIAYNRGYDKPVEFAVERWMQSTAHRENILNNSWNESAVGVAMADDGAFYFTQVFLLRK